MTQRRRQPVTFATALGGLPYERALPLALAAEANGFTSIALADRPHDPIEEGWTLGAAIAARTERIRIFHATLNIPYRFPALLAKEAATLDIISGGRLDLCLGAGGEGNRPLYDSIGVPLGQPADRLADLVDTIAILRGMWANEKFTYQGRVYHVDDANGLPHPLQQPLPIWVGALLPRSLRLAGRLADGFLKNQGWGSVEQLTDLNRQVDAAAIKAGRDPGAIKHIINGRGELLRAGESPSPVPAGLPLAGGLVGSSAAILQTIRDYRNAGVDTFTVRFAPDQAEEQMRRFGSEIIPEAAKL